MALRPERKPDLRASNPPVVESSDQSAAMYFPSFKHFCCHTYICLRSRLQPFVRKTKGAFLSFSFTCSLYIMDRPKRDSRTRQVVERWREQEHENNYFGFDPVTPLTDKRYKPHQETGNPSRHQKQDIAWHSSTSLYPEEPESRDLPMRLNPEFYRPDSAFHCQTEEKDCNTPDLWGFDPAIPSKQAPIYSEKNWAQSGFNEEKPAGKTTDNMVKRSQIPRKSETFKTNRGHPPVSRSKLNHSLSPNRQL